MIEISLGQWIDSRASPFVGRRSVTGEADSMVATS